jgi:hypothetical protein
VEPDHLSAAATEPAVIEPEGRLRAALCVSAASRKALNASH